MKLDQPSLQYCLCVFK